MEHFVWPRKDYRHVPLRADDRPTDKYGAPPVNLTQCVPMPSAPRRIDWDVVLRWIAPRQQEDVRREILARHLDLFIDGDHPVVKEAGALQFALTYPDYLPPLPRGVDVRGHSFTTTYPPEWRLTYVRRLGLSLDEVSAIPGNGTHAWFTRRLTQEGDLVEESRPCWLLPDAAPPPALADSKKRRRLPPGSKKRSRPVEEAPSAAPPSKRARRSVRGRKKV